MRTLEGALRKVAKDSITKLGGLDILGQ